AGRWITFASRNLTPALDGDNIVLTIDPAIQFKSQEVLRAAIESHQAEGGSVIVVNPKTGAILAMANYPEFDPNVYNQVPDISYYSNRSLAIDYEPGSIFKPITMAAALNEGKVTPETTYEDTGEVQLDEFKIKNSDGKAHGIQTMTQVLEQSLNTGMIFAEKEVGHDAFRRYVKDFGFGELVNIELPGEVKGNLDNLTKKHDVFYGTASYGQGITVTPLQMIQAYTALANNGKMMQPYVVSKIIHPNGSEEVSKPRMVNKVLEPRTAGQLSSMLVNVVENGHGKRAAVKGYYIAGKTGTAQVANRDRVGYDPNKSIGSFIGYGPVDNPAFLMLVRIDNPKDVKFAESTAAPAFGEIAGFILNYMQIPPSRK
ncbi:MAG TPA: penicillin-binding protein 2, partial [Verrucomicrobiae bacterium]|nr:penicillin-binding protein 2 [Verrucomicrobiae bacterium]